jgi:hypothetical protein
MLLNSLKNFKNIVFVVNIVIKFIKYTPPILNIRLINHQRLTRRRLRNNIIKYHNVSSNYIDCINNDINVFENNFEYQSKQFINNIYFFEKYMNNLLNNFIDETNKNFILILNELDKVNNQLDYTKNMINDSQYYLKVNLKDIYNKNFDNYNLKNSIIINNFFIDNNYINIINKYIEDENKYLQSQINKLEEIQIYCIEHSNILEIEKQQLNHILNKLNKYINKFNKYIYLKNDENFVANSIKLNNYSLIKVN